MLEDSPAIARKSSAAASHTECRGSAIAPLEVAVTGHRPERKKLGIAVIAQVKNARKTRRGVERLALEAVVALRRGEIGDATRDRGMIRFAVDRKAKQRPGGL